MSVEGQFEELNNNWNELAPKTFAFDSFVPKSKQAWVSEKIREFYFDNKPLDKIKNLESLVRLYTDALILVPVYQAALNMALNGLMVWPYMFSYIGEHGLGEHFGMSRKYEWVGHGDDLLYFFNHPGFGFGPLTPDSEDERFSKGLVKLWTDFAETGYIENLT